MPSWEAIHFTYELLCLELYLFDTHYFLEYFICIFRIYIGFIFSLQIYIWLSSNSHLLSNSFHKVKSLLSTIKDASLFTVVSTYNIFVGYGGIYLMSPFVFFFSPSRKKTGRSFKENYLYFWSNSKYKLLSKLSLYFFDLHVLANFSMCDLRIIKVFYFYIVVFLFFVKIYLLNDNIWIFETNMLSIRDLLITPAPANPSTGFNPGGGNNPTPNVNSNAMVSLNNNNNNSNDSDQNNSVNNNNSNRFVLSNYIYMRPILGEFVARIGSHPNKGDLYITALTHRNDPAEAAHRLGAWKRGIFANCVIENRNAPLHWVQSMPCLVLTGAPGLEAFIQCNVFGNDSAVILPNVILEGDNINAKHLIVNDNGTISLRVTRRCFNKSASESSRIE